jgi:hypothetical protein
MNDINSFYSLFITHVLTSIFIKGINSYECYLKQFVIVIYTCKVV